jgi:hypothetical protein
VSAALAAHEVFPILGRVDDEDGRAVRWKNENAVRSACLGREIVGELRKRRVVIREIEHVAVPIDRCGVPRPYEQSGQPPLAGELAALAELASRNRRRTQGRLRVSRPRFEESPLGRNLCHSLASW